MGSEMCIRDSYTVYRRIFHLKAPKCKLIYTKSVSNNYQDNLRFVNKGLFNKSMMSGRFTRCIGRISVLLILVIKLFLVKFQIKVSATVSIMSGLVCNNVMCRAPLGDGKVYVTFCSHIFCSGCGEMVANNLTCGACR